jgi:hypothetical protein
MTQPREPGEPGQEINDSAAHGVEDAPPAPRPALSFDPHDAPSLQPDTIDEFLRWVGAVPRSHRANVRSAISSASHPELVSALTDALHDLPVTDLGRHLMLLSTIGELRDARAVEPLTRFIWHEGPLVVPPGSGDDAAGTATSILDFTDGLQARATEMLAYLGTDDALAATLDVAARHRSAAVRAAAIDAYMYSHDDSPEAADRLRERVQPEEVKLIGLPRFTADMDRTEFDRRVAEFYERYPDERPPAPSPPAIRPPSPGGSTQN